MEEGWDRFSAATFAYQSTAFPMLTGTLITAAGFLPIATARSTTGEYTFAIFAVVAMSIRPERHAHQLQQLAGFLAFQRVVKDFGILALDLPGVEEEGPVDVGNEVVEGGTEGLRDRGTERQRD
jgi:hypothetical protein